MLFNSLCMEKLRCNRLYEHPEIGCGISLQSMNLVPLAVDEVLLDTDLLG